MFKSVFIIFNELLEIIQQKQYNGPKSKRNLKTKWNSNNLETVVIYEGWSLSYNWAWCIYRSKFT